ncbi:hypothetical protein CRG98_017830 [Punica granatum]|uniref:Chromo domain-containing protein n=1 Tax=Punica granatum TaxID=22663 RepID=A0A2I0K0Z5_PUNGR|nr:hypothetical protein CRG98_017830 [Punica granatum]
MRAEIDELRAELVQVRRTRGNGGGMGQFSARPDVPRSKEFKGARVAKDVDNFIWKDEARAKLRRLEHKGELREYVRQFTELMLQIPSLTDKEAFFQFMDGLKPWAKQSCNAAVCKICTRLCRWRNCWKANQSKGLMFADVEIAKKAFSALVDTGASNLFTSEEGAKKLGLRVERTRGRLKTDVMPTKLPKKLPPKREVDHRIDLMPDAKPLAMAPYRMAPPELLDAGYVRPSKAPFGAPENSLYVKREKCAFTKREVPFLGHIVGGGRVRMDPSKVASIMEWKSPTKVTELRSFLGLANYYRRFIKGYSSITVPLTDLLKKARAWEWTDECQAAFDRLKRVVTDEPVLALPCYEKSFEVDTDASDFAIGGVLMQDGHPIAFESRKLSDRYTVQEKEMTAVVHCLRTWRHHLLGSKFVVRTNNIATSYFQTQKKLSPKQARWQDFLAEFDFVMEYKPGRTNAVADALSRRVELAAISRLESPWLGWIKEGLQHDAKARILLELAREGKSRQFCLHPQTDGQTERVNTLLELYLRHYMSTTQKDWATMIDAAQFSYNLQRSESTGKSPFEIVTGQQPSTPSTVASGYKGNSPATYKLAKSWQKEADLARSCLNRATNRMKKWADKKRRHVEYSVGDLVLVKLHNILRHKNVHKGLTRRYEGPFQVLQRVGNVAYKVELPKKLKLHPVFHVSMLKPFKEDKEDPSRAESSRAPIGAKAAYDQDVEQILVDRVVRKRWCKPKREYLIKWKGLPESEASWEPAEDLWQFTKQIEAFYVENATRASPE